MMEAFAHVERIEHGRAWLRLSSRGGGCGRCDEPGGCRSVQLTHVLGAPRDLFALPTRPDIRVGDRVRITIPEGAPLQAALLGYGLGVLLLLIGAALGVASGDGAADDLRALVGALTGLTLSFVLNRLLARSRRWRTRLQMELSPAGEAPGPDHACARKDP